MKFSMVKIAVAALSYSNAVLGALTPTQIVDNIKMLTDKSQALQAPAQSLTIVNGPLIVVGQGPFPQIITGFTDIINTATTAVSQMEGTPSITDAADSDAIFDAFREFVRVHQVLLNILIGKAGLFQTVPFIGAPVAAVLRQVEQVVDTIAFGLIDLVQSRATDLQNQAGNLGMTIESAIEQYEGINLHKRSASFRALRV